MDCPIANAYAPEISRIVRDYRKNGVAFAVIYPIPDLTKNEAKDHCKEYGFDCTAILDRDLQLARQLGATTTPEAIVVNTTN